MSYRYAIVDRTARSFIIVNAEYSDRLYARIDVTPCQSGGTSRVKGFRYSQGIQTKTLLLDEGLDDYEILRLIFTSNNGSLVTSRYMPLNKRGKAMDYVMDEDDYQSSIQYAKFVLWFDRILNDLPKAIEGVVEISRFVKEKEDEESCVTCHEEYQSDCMIGRLPCKHSFHEECIKNWFKKRKTSCPICRCTAFSFSR